MTGPYLEIYCVMTAYLIGHVTCYVRTSYLIDPVIYYVMTFYWTDHVTYYEMIFCCVSIVHEMVTLTLTSYDVSSFYYCHCNWDFYSLIVMVFETCVC